MHTVERNIFTEFKTGLPVGTKYFTDKPLALNWVHVHYTSDSTSGSRTILFTLYDRNGNALYDIRSSVNQGNNQVRHYNFVHGAPRETGWTHGDEVVLPLAHIVIMPGQYITISDEDAISAGDTYEIAFQADL
jgi:hypothetical protein